MHKHYCQKRALVTSVDSNVAMCCMSPDLTNTETQRCRRIRSNEHESYNRWPICRWPTVADMRDALSIVIGVIVVLELCNVTIAAEGRASMWRQSATIDDLVDLSVNLNMCLNLDR
jgi:hypothetical protein